MCQRAGRGWLCHCGALSPKAGLGWPFPPWVAYLKKTKARSFPRQTVAAPFEEVGSRTSPAPQSASLFGFLFARPLHTCHGHQEASSSDTQELPENWGREQVVSFQGRAPLDHPQSQPCLAFQAKENYSSVGVGQDSRPGGPAAPGAWGPCTCEQVLAFSALPTQCCPHMCWSCVTRSQAHRAGGWQTQGGLQVAPGLTLGMSLSQDRPQVLGLPWLAAMMPVTWLHSVGDRFCVHRPGDWVGCGAGGTHGGRCCRRSDGVGTARTRCFPPSACGHGMNVSSK